MFIRLFLASLLFISAQAQAGACTREYIPVCGRLGKEIKTFPTRCVMQSQGGTWLSDGACPPEPKPVIAGRIPTVVPEAAPKSEEFILIVAPDDVDCVGVAPMRCLQVKTESSNEWSAFYQSIHGFTFKPDTTYQLLVRATPIPNPPADSSNTRYTLVRVLSSE